MTHAQKPRALKSEIPSSFSEMTDVISFGPFRLIQERRELTENNQALRLGSRALEILLILVRHAGEVVSKDRLIAEVWPDAVIDEGTLRVQIAALRKALGDGTGGRRYITNVPQRGYCFVAPLTPIRENQTPASVSFSGFTAKQVPSPVTNLIGREDVIDNVLALLSVRRFVTIVGPGGIGKTSVALTVADDLRGEVLHGSYLVEFDAITNPSSVSSAIASALGLSSLTSDPTPQIAAFLQDKQILLVLDNCEHVVDEVARIAEELLVNAPSIRVLATSREPLHARGEWVQRLSPLRLPLCKIPSSVIEAASFPAIELFVERTTACLGDFILTDADVPYVTKICRRLDGIPLAIELAARRVGLFGLQELAVMLDDRLSLSTQGHRTALPRHKTMLATLDWSYELLTETEKTLLCSLSVFSESFSLDSAIKIANGIDIGNSDVIEGIASLVDKSLLVMQHGGRHASYRLLNTTRTYAGGKLQTLYSCTPLQKRHAILVDEILVDANRDLKVKTPVEWCQEHGRKIDDVRAALEWAFSSDGDTAIAVELVVVSASMWFQLHLFSEYLEWLGRAMAITACEYRSASQKLQLALAIGNVYLYTRGPSQEAFDALTEGYELATELNDIAVLPRALWGLCTFHRLRGDYRKSLEYANRLGELAQNLENQFATLTSHRIAATSSHLVGDQFAARAHAVKALEPYFAKQHIHYGSAYQIDHVSASLTQLARVLWIQGYPDQAMSAIKEALKRAEATNLVLSITQVLLFGACPIALWAGDLDVASEYVRKLQACTTEHSLPFCKEWADKYAHALRLKMERLDTIRQNRIETEFEEAEMCDSLVDMIATLNGRFVGKRAIDRSDAGQNGWCIAEILRVQGEHALHRKNPSELEAETFFLRSLDLAKTQGANFWTLKTSLSYSRLLHARGKGQRARKILSDAMAKFDEGFGIQDLLDATDFLNRLSN